MIETKTREVFGGALITVLALVGGAPWRVSPELGSATGLGAVAKT